MIDRWWSKGLLVLAVTALACGGEAEEEENGDEPEDDRIEITAPTEPEPPTAVLMTPCPEGWREAEEDGRVTCDPYPEDGATECPDGEVHFPGAPGCSPIGDPCPEGDWPETLPVGRSILHVQDGAEGGDGSREEPFGTIEEALAIAGAGDIVAIARGTYDEVLDLPAGVTLWGACARDTHLMSTESPAPASRGSVLSTQGAGVELRNLRISGEREGIAFRGSAAGASLHGILVESTTCLGIAIAGEIEASGLVVREVSQCADGSLGYGVYVGRNGSLTAERIIVDRSHAGGLVVRGSTASVVLRNAVVRKTQPRSDDLREGEGIYLDGGARLEARGLLVERNHAVGLSVWDEGTRVDLADVVIRDTQPEARSHRLGIGVLVREGAELAAEAVLVTRNRERGILVQSAGTRVEISRSLVEETGARENDSLGGEGIVIDGGAVLTAEGVSLRGNHATALAVWEAETRVDIQDLTVFDTQPQAADDQAGYGVLAAEGAWLLVERMHLRGNHTGALVTADDGTVVELADVLIEATRSRASDGRFGFGIQAFRGARLQADRVRLERNRSDSVIGFHHGTSIELSNVVVSETLEAACGTDDCAGFAGGGGLSAVENATIEASRFRVELSALTGVLLGRGGEIDLSDGEIAENPIGANVQTEDFDLGRITEHRVHFRDNDLNLDSSSLPLPEPMGQ